MSPEPEFYIGRLRQVSKVADGIVEQNRQENDKAWKAKDLDRADQITKDTKLVVEFEQQFSEILDSAEALLAAHPEMRKIDIPLEENAPKGEFNFGRRALAIGLLLDRDENGKFINTPSGIARSQRQLAMTGDDISKSKSVFKRDLLDFSLDHPEAHTISDVLDLRFGSNLEKVRSGHEAWKELYQRIKLEFGELPVEVFISEILDRKIPELQSSQEQETEALIEATLASRLSYRVHNGKNIRTMFKSDAQYNTVLKNAGLDDPANLEERLRVAKEDACAKYHGDHLEGEAKISFDDALVSKISDMFQSTDPKEYPVTGEFSGLNLVRAIAFEFRGKMDKANELLSVLFPQYIITADGNDWVASFRDVNN